ncbi:MAG: hypothetical protein H6908_02355 [Hyphomicrobiales bacterium]|nr:hypothetical protein [Rickettsiales bacterium]MCP5361473.1 hypothetical protein [Hyphomicrobiales bacterium]
MGELTTAEIQQVRKKLLAVDDIHLIASGENIHEKAVVSVLIPGDFTPQDVGVIAAILEKNHDDLKINATPVIVPGQGLYVSFNTGVDAETLKDNAEEAKVLQPLANIYLAKMRVALEKERDADPEESVRAIQKIMQETQEAYTSAYAETHKNVSEALKEGQNVAIVINVYNANYLPQMMAAIDAMGAYHQDHPESKIALPVYGGYLPPMADGSAPPRNEFHAIIQQAASAVGLENLVGNAAQALVPPAEYAKMTNEQKDKVSDDFAEAIYKKMQQTNATLGKTPALFMVNPEYGAGLPENTRIIDVSGLTKDNHERNYLADRFTVSNNNAREFLDALGGQKQVLMENHTVMHVSRALEMIQEARQAYLKTLGKGAVEGIQDNSPDAPPPEGQNQPEIPRKPSGNYR